MTKASFASLIILLFLFSGCLLANQITIKSAELSGDNITVELHSSNKVNADIKLSQDNSVSCQKSVVLEQGTNTIEMKCNLTGEKVRVEVTAEGLVISKEITLELEEVSNTNEKVLSLAGKNIEAEFLEAFERNFNRTQECNAEKYIDRLNQAMDKMSEIYTPGFTPPMDDDLTQEQMDLLDEEIKKTKNCSLHVKKEIDEQGNDEYLVNYSLVAEGDCGYFSQGITATEDMLIIQVDLKDNSTEIIKGEMSSPYYSEATQRKQIEVYDLIGECFKPMMLGVSSVLVSPSNSNVTNLDLEIIEMPNYEPVYKEIHITDLYKYKQGGTLDIGELTVLNSDFQRVINIGPDDLIRIKKEDLSFYRVIVINPEDLTRIQLGDYVLGDLEVYRIISIDEDDLIKIKKEDYTIENLKLYGLIFINPEDLTVINGEQTINLDIQKIIPLNTTELKIKKLETDYVLDNIQIYKIINLDLNSP